MMTLVVSQNGWNLLDSSWIELSQSSALPSFVFGAALFYNRNMFRDFLRQASSWQS